MQQPAATFNGNASANALGVHRRVGGCVTAVPDEMYPWPAHYVRQIREEIDPCFIPLWAVTLWRTPNDGFVTTSCHAVGRYVRNPLDGRNVLKNLHMPIRNHFGIHYQSPIVQGPIFDGLTEQERNKGVLPRYEPITGQIVGAMRVAMWKRNNQDIEARIREIEEYEDEQEKRRSLELSQSLAYKRKNDEAQWKQVRGQAGRVFVSETLIKLRETAGLKECVA